MLVRPLNPLIALISLSFLLVASPAVAEWYEYDGLDRLTRVFYDDGTTVSFDYDPAGNIIGRTVPEPGVGTMLIAGVLTLAGLRSRRTGRRSERGAGPRAYRRTCAVFPVVLVAMTLASLLLPGDARAQSTQASRTSGNWQDEAFTRIRRAEYEVSFAHDRQRGRDAWQAPNRAQGFRTRFLDGKVEIGPRDTNETSWEIGLSPMFYGRGSEGEAIGKTAPRIDGARVRYARGAVVEWFRNEPQGLKQGFTLQTPPRDRVGGVRGRSGASSASAEPAYVSLRVDGNARAVLAADRQSIRFESSASPIALAHYSELVVLDARGTPLDSWMEVRSEGGAQTIRLVFDDREAEYPVEIDPILTTPAWSVSGNQPEAGLGFSVAGAGDVNNDGFDDVLVSAPFFDYAGEIDAGRVYLFLGSAGGLSPVASWVRNSPDATGSDLFGFALAGGEDVNGDGYDDFLVSELNPYGPTDPPNFPNGSGVVYLFLGGPAGPGSSPDWQLTGRPGDRLGFSIDLIGADLNRGKTTANGDYYADVVIGEPGSWGNTDDGRVYVFYGRTDGLLGGAATCTAVATPGGGATCGGPQAVDATIWGEAGSYDYFGERVAYAGDVDCDGDSDLVVGQPRYDNPRSTADYGRIQVFFGCNPNEGVGCPVGVVPPGIDTNASWEVLGSDVGVGDNFFGASVETAPFVDGDEHCDVILVGAPGRDTNGNTTPWDVGAVFKVYAVLDESSFPVPDPGSPYLSAPLIEGTISGERVGDAIAVAGDVNDDRSLDFLFGAPGGINHQGAGADRGRVYMKSRPSDYYENQSLEDIDVVWRITGSEAGDHLGSAIAGVGDVDNDGLDDFIVGSSSGLHFLFDPNSPANIIPTKPGDARLYMGRQPDSVGSLLGLEPGEFDEDEAWAYIARGSLGDVVLVEQQSPTSPAVGAGDRPDSLLITSGLAQDQATGATDWGEDGAPDLAGAGLELNVPTNARSLRFTTQYLTADPNVAPRTVATVYVDGHPLELETAIAEAGRGFQHAPMSHGIAIPAGANNLVLRFELEEATAGAADAGLLVSRLFFSELDLPDHLNDEACVTSGTCDRNSDGLADYVPNPVSTDLSKSRGSFSYRLPLLEAPGGQLPLEFTLTYSSEDDQEGALGRSWRHSLQARLTEDRDYENLPGPMGEPPAPTNDCPDSIYVTIGERVEVFDEPEGETNTICHEIAYAPRYQSVYSTLDLDSDGRYFHRTKGGVESRFEPFAGASGTFRLAEVSNRWSESITFAYDATAPTLPVSIVDSVGESYLLTYDDLSAESPRLTGFFGSSYELGFAYDAAGFLASVFDLNGLETAIEMDGRGRVLSIVDADGTRIVGNEYESFSGIGLDQEGRRLVRQRNGYPADLGASFSYVDEYFEQVSREGGRVLERYDPFGRRADRRVLIDEARFADLDQCDRADDWCALTEYAYDGDGNLVRETDPRGIVRAMKYDDRGNRICVTEDAEGALASPPRTPIRTRYIYDLVNDNLLEQLDQKVRSVLPADCPDTAPYDLVSDPQNWNVTRYTYDPVTGEGPFSIVKVGDGGEDRVLDMTYDGSLVSATIDPEGRTTTYTYDEVSNLASETDALGYVTQFQHDALGRRTLVSGPQMTFFENGAPITTSAIQRQLWDAGGRLLSTIDPFQHTTSFTYDGQGRQLTRVDERGEIWTRSYTPTGELEALTSPLGNSISLGYDAEDRLISRTDARGSAYARRYDARGDLTDAIDPLGGMTTFEYDRSGNLTAVTDPRFFRGEIEYDAQGRESILRDPLGREEVFTRDAQGRILTRTRPGPSGTPAVWADTYTATGELATSTDPEGLSTAFSYSRTGRVTSTARVQDGQTTRLAYDALDRVSQASVTHPGAGSTVVVVDFEEAVPGTLIPPTYVEHGVAFESLGGLGDPQQIVDSGGNNALVDSNPQNFFGAGSAMTLTSDAPFDLISFDVADLTNNPAGGGGVPGSGSRIEIDADGQILVFTPTSSTFTTETLNLTGLTSLTIAIVSAASGADEFAIDNITLETPAPLVVASYDYDAAGNLTTVTDPNGHQTEYEYDRLGRKTREQDAVGAQVRFEYDARGALSALFNARGESLGYTYDADGRQTGTSSSDTATGSWSIQETLDENGNATSSVGSNASFPVLAPATVDRTFDLLDRQLTRTVTLPSGMTKTVESEYDASGNLTAVVYSDGSRVDYTYDALDRLVSVVDGIRTTTYEYDAAGNLSRVVRPDGSETTYTFDRAGRMLGMNDTRAAATIFSAAYTLDAAGRRKSADIERPLPPVAGASETFAYDDANRMSTRSSDATPLVHDADGNLVSAMLGGSPRTLEYNALNQLVRVDGESILYDADGRRVERTSGGVTSFYLYDTEGRLIEELDASGATIARYVHGLGLVSRQAAGGAVSVYHYDSRGSTVALTDLNGAITDRYAYTPYGALAASVGATPNPFTYSGRDGVFDDGNGLYHMPFRYYAPELMRFVQKDPVYSGELDRPLSLNRYAFVEGNPIERIDPSGAIFGGVSDFFEDVGDTFESAYDYFEDGDFVDDLESLGESVSDGFVDFGDLIQDGVDEIGGWEAVAGYAIAGVAIVATGGSAAVIIGAAAGAGFAAATGGNIGVGAGVGALSAFGVVAAGGAGFGGALLQNGGDFEDAAISGVIAGVSAGIAGKAVKALPAARFATASVRPGFGVVTASSRVAFKSAYPLASKLIKAGIGGSLKTAFKQGLVPALR